MELRRKLFPSAARAPLVSRRQMLEALLSAPIAAAACRRKSLPPFAGSLRGPSMDVGHKLREAARAAIPAHQKRTHVHVAIVGAGPSGLSAAWRLERLGIKDFVVFDLEGRPGGTSQYGDDAIVPYPWGAHYVPMPSAENRAMVELLRELGAITGIDARGAPIAAEEQLVRAPEERVFYLDRWYEGLYLRAGASADDLEQFHRFQAEIDRFADLRDGSGRRAFALPMAHGSTDADLTALDRTSMAEWLAARGFTSRRLRWWVDYACRDDYGLLASETSAWAGLFYYAARTQGKGDAAAPLLSWPHGNGRLVEHLAAVAGDRVRVGQLVADIAPRRGPGASGTPGAPGKPDASGAPVDDGVDLSVLDTASGELRGWSADHVIFAAPKFTAAHVIRPWRERPPEHLANLDYGAWMVANLHLKGRPASRGFPMAWDNVLYDSPSLGYVVATHQKLRDHGPTVWTYYYPFTSADPRADRARLLALDHAAACDVIVSDLSRAHRDLASYVERIDVFRWGHAMARPRVGHVWTDARARRAEPLGRIRFAHSDLSGIGLFEEAQYWGIHAAEDIAKSSGRTFASLLERSG
ncbi:flavin monoamine oxidase family protein [Pendulispora albinea]|uniref:NAD(P)/FAD-dependent oxidoreductase n=1 Tax=Pendulispora albinea TaxID=2741071 RepID=A0ABZ2LKC4_9BACT